MEGNFFMDFNINIKNEQLREFLNRYEMMLDIAYDGVQLIFSEVLCACQQVFDKVNITQARFWLSNYTCKNHLYNNIAKTYLTELTTFITDNNTTNSIQDTSLYKDIMRYQLYGHDYIFYYCPLKDYHDMYDRLMQLQKLIFENDCDLQIQFKQQLYYKEYGQQLEYILYTMYFNKLLFLSKCPLVSFDYFIQHSILRLLRLISHIMVDVLYKQILQYQNFRKQFTTEQNKVIDGYLNDLHGSRLVFTVSQYEQLVRDFVYERRFYEPFVKVIPSNNSDVEYSYNSTSSDSLDNCIQHGYKYEVLNEPMDIKFDKPDTGILYQDDDIHIEIDYPEEYEEYEEYEESDDYMFSFHHPESFLWNESDDYSYYDYETLIDRTTFQPYVEPVNSSSSSSSFIIDNVSPQQQPLPFKRDIEFDIEFDDKDLGIL